MSSMITGYNPDVLSCLANLSNDEVFTPPEVANAMLDMLPQELFSDPNTKFLDPACKSGVFLREIAKRLIDGLKDQIPDLQERLDHIYHEQLYGIAITELTSLLSRRSLYCTKYPNSVYSVSKFDDQSGNIRYKRIPHRWKEGKCVFCGATQEQYDRDESLETHAYELLHTVYPERLFNMRFDVIISNPPYQLTTGGGDNGTQAKPLYNVFVDQAKKLNPRYITMILPARWYSGGIGLNEFRSRMLTDRHITHLVDFEDSKDCFSGVDIAGGVCYFLWDRDHVGDCSTESTINGKHYCSSRKLDEFDVFIRNPIAAEIVKKVTARTKETLSARASSQQPFGLKSNVQFIQDGDLDLRTRNGWGKYKRNLITKNEVWLDKYKVITSKTAAEHAGMADKNGQKKILSVIEVMNPNSACSESYRVMDVFSDKDRAENMATYLRTKFARFLVSTRALSQNLSVNSFLYVPYEDFSVQWKDEDLYSKYGLTSEEIDFIEATIKPME